ncbi:MAG: hypothetical protein F7C32_04060 [Desulfurococcales archaeon]|nr:hypothetical protein [Desulfurococcales archaeon]
MVDELQLVNIEGMAMTGNIVDVEIVKCNRKGFARVRATTREGRVVETKCIEEEAAKRNYAVIRLYIKWGPYIVKRK